MLTFSRCDRVLSSSDFLKVKKTGVSISSGKLKIAFLKGKSKRLGTVVGKSCGSAPKRNRIKRIVREHFRLNRDLYPQGDVVVIAMSGAQSQTNEELRATLFKGLLLLSAKREKASCLKE
ncbi:MAG: ribonuclease P protein component [Pseudomonadota bacterium]